MTEINFNQVGDFEAYHAACTWCKDNGYSYGSMQRDAPMGILKGDWCIAKWRNLTPKERSQLDGQITSNDFRAGPVTIKLKDAPLPEEIESGKRLKQAPNQ